MSEGKEEKYEEEARGKITWRQSSSTRVNELQRLIAKLSVFERWFMSFFAEMLMEHRLINVNFLRER